MIILLEALKNIYDKCYHVFFNVSLILWSFVCVYKTARWILPYLFYCYIFLCALVLSWRIVSYPFCHLPFTTEFCDSTWCTISDSSTISSRTNRSAFDEAINSTYTGFTNAIHEGSPLVTLPYRLLYADDALWDARWLIESSELSSRTRLVRIIVQYLEVSGPVRDDLYMFIAQVGGTIDFVLLVIDWTVQDLTQITQQTETLKNPSVTMLTHSTIKDLIPYDHARVLLDYATAVVFPDFLFRSSKALYGSLSKASAGTATNSVVSAFTTYISEISPRITVLISQADELLANLKGLHADLDSIRSVTVYDNRSLSASRAVIEEQRWFWTRFWVTIGGGVEDVGAIERQVDMLSRIDQVVKDGVKSLNGILWALGSLKENLKRYTNLHRSAKEHETPMICHIKNIQISAEKLKLAQADWAYLRRKVTEQIFNRDMTVCW